MLSQPCLLLRLCVRVHPASQALGLGTIAAAGFLAGGGQENNLLNFFGIEPLRDSAFFLVFKLCLKRIEALSEEFGWGDEYAEETIPILFRPVCQGQPKMVLCHHSTGQCMIQ